MRAQPQLVLALFAAACASSGMGPAGSKPLPIGVYHVLERVQRTNPPVTIEGTITILPDTLIAEFTPGPCTTTPSSTTAFNLRCAEVEYTFEKRDPLLYNYYAVKTSETVTDRKCVQYVANRCVQYETSVKEQNATRTGRLHPTMRGSP